MGHSPEKPASTLPFVRRIFATGRFFIAPLVARRAMWPPLISTLGPAGIAAPRLG